MNRPDILQLGGQSLWAFGPLAQSIIDALEQARPGRDVRPILDKLVHDAQPAFDSGKITLICDEPIQSPQLKLVGDATTSQADATSLNILRAIAQTVIQLCQAPVQAASSPVLGGLQTALDRSRALASRTNQTLALMLLETDSESSTFSTEQVDQALLGIMRASDIATRINEHQVALMVMVDRDRTDGIARAARRLTRAMAARFNPTHPVGHPTSSAIQGRMGITFVGSQHASIDQLLQEACNAATNIPFSADFSFAFHQADHQKAILNRLEIEDALRLALREQRLELHYQPIVDRDGCVKACEALLRWNEPKVGRIGPDVFIPIAEQSELIIEIDRYVLSCAARQATAWQELCPGIRIAINISAQHFARPDFVESVMQIVRDAGADASSIELEITETALMKRAEQATLNVRALRQLGFRVAIDDFGTGYSSLAYLHRLPVDALKVDRSFVCEVGHLDSPDHDVRTAIIRSIASLAKGLNMELVAEGIESEVQRIYLSQLGVHLMQGYHIARPMPVDEAAQVIARLNHTLRKVA